MLKSFAYFNFCARVIVLHSFELLWLHLHKKPMILGQVDVLSFTSFTNSLTDCLTKFCNFSFIYKLSMEISDS
jgi:hypothetical protein